MSFGTYTVTRNPQVTLCAGYYVKRGIARARYAITKLAWPLVGWSSRIGHGELYNICTDPHVTLCAGFPS